MCQPTSGRASQLNCSANGVWGRLRPAISDSLLTRVKRSHPAIYGWLLCVHTQRGTESGRKFSELTTTRQAVKAILLTLVTESFVCPLYS